MRRAAFLEALLFASLVGIAAAGCSMLAGAGADPTAQRCEQVYSARRCLAIADAATDYSDQTRDDVAEVLIVPSAPPSDGIIQTLGGATPITVRIVMRDGTTSDTNMCAGIASGPACADEPPAWESGTGDLIGSGYHDVPAGATPIPSMDPGIASDGVAIAVPSRTIAIDHAGPYEVPLGTGALPNGIVSAATYRIADPWASDVTYREDATPRVVIRSLEPDGKPFSNAYEHGWREGVEQVEAVLVFDVKRFDPGATIEVIDVVVR